MTGESQYDGPSVAMLAQIKIVCEGTCAGVFEKASVLRVYFSNRSNSS